MGGDRVDIEQDEEGEAYVLQKNNGRRIIPTVEFADGSILVEPSNAELAAKLGLKIKAERSHYDLIVVGGGPAGLTAALYAAREGIDALVIARVAPATTRTTAVTVTSCARAAMPWRTLAAIPRTWNSHRRRPRGTE
jgi:hypothetical protein